MGLALACTDEAGDLTNVGGSSASPDAGSSAGSGGAGGSGGNVDAGSGAANAGRAASSNDADAGNTHPSDARGN